VVRGFVFLGLCYGCCFSVCVLVAFGLSPLIHGGAGVLHNSLLARRSFESVPKTLHFPGTFHQTPFPEFRQHPPGATPFGCGVVISLGRVYLVRQPTLSFPSPLLPLQANPSFGQFWSYYDICVFLSHVFVASVCARASFA